MSDIMTLSQTGTQRTSLAVNGAVDNVITVENSSKNSPSNVATSPSARPTSHSITTGGGGTSRNDKDGDHDSGVDETTQEKELPKGSVQTSMNNREEIVASASSPTSSQFDKNSRTSNSCPTTTTAASAATTPSSTSCRSSSGQPQPQPTQALVPAPTPPSSAMKAPSTPDHVVSRELKLPVAKSRAQRSKSECRSKVMTPPSTSDSANSHSSEFTKKIPMNKIQVGTTGSPNLKAVTSKIGSLANATYKPGGGKVMIEHQKLDFNKAQPRIEALNSAYKPQGGEKKILTQKLNWNAKSKIGSLENATHKPGGGDKKIETQKVDFKAAKSKVGSKDYLQHKAGGGDVKIESRKLDFRENAQSRVASLENAKHQPGGGDKKIFDDKEYLRQISARPSAVNSASHSKANSEGRSSGSQSPAPSDGSSQVQS